MVEGWPLISSPDAAISKQLREQTEMVLGTLPPREAAVLRVCFGIGEVTQHTRDEVSKLLALSCGRADQIVAEALRKMRQPGRTTHMGSLRRI